MIKNKMQIYGMTIFSIIVVMSAFSLIFGKSVMQTKNIQTGRLIYEIPEGYYAEKTDTMGVVRFITYGEMDEREIGYLNYIRIYWSDSEINESTILPASGYRRESETVSNIDICGDRNAKYIKMQIMIKKPCGRVIVEKLYTIKFTDNKTKLHFAVSGLVRPSMQEVNLIAIAESINSK